MRKIKVRRRMDEGSPVFDIQMSNGHWQPTSPYNYAYWFWFAIEQCKTEQAIAAINNPA